MARLLGKADARVVRRWCTPDGPGRGEACPHTRGKRGKMDIVLFDLEEVKSWCQRHGIAIAGSELFSSKTAAASGSGSGGGVGGVAGVGGSGVQGEDELAGDLLMDVRVGDERRAFRETLSLLRQQAAQIQTLISTKNANGLSAQQLKVLTETAARASMELRQLDDAETKARKARGDMVDRRGAEQCAEAMGDAVQAAQSSLVDELGPALRAIGCRIGEGEQSLSVDAFDRLVCATVSPLFDSANAMVAKSAAKACEDLKRLAGDALLNSESSIASSAAALSRDVATGNYRGAA